MFKSTEASAIQELKTYIATLEQEKINLKKGVEWFSVEVTQRMKDEDFNFYQAKKFENGCKNIRKILDSDMKKVKARHQEYKVEKMMIKGKVKVRHFETEKKRLKD